MTDIAKCHGDGCTIRDTCRRFTAPPSFWQRYEQGAYILGACDLFLPEAEGLGERPANRPDPSPNPRKEVNHGQEENDQRRKEVLK